MKFFTILIGFICYSLHLPATTELFHQFAIQNLTHEDGLANNTLLEIHQDKRGFLWLGTDIGLSRYDGKRFHNYELQGAEPYAIKRICELEQEELLWLKFDRRPGMACFDKETGEFVPLFSNADDFLANIHDLCASDSVLYAITSSSIQRIYYQRDLQGIQLTADTIVTGESPLRQLQADNHRVYAMDDNHILIYSLRDKQLQDLNRERLNIKGSILDIRAFNGYLWINTLNEGIFCYQPETDELRKLEIDSKLPTHTKFCQIDMLNESSFVVTTSNTVFLIKFEGSDLIHDSFAWSERDFESFNYGRFVKERITQLYIDQNNRVVWLGTFGKGLIKINLRNKNINHIPLNEKIKTVNGMAQDAEGHLWLSTEHSGIWRSKNNQLSTEMDFMLWERSISNGYYCLYKDENGNLWVGDETGTLQCINPLTYKTTSFYPQTKDGASVGRILKVYLCIHNKAWLVTDKGLFIYDHLSNQCIASLSYTDFQKITALHEDGDGVMWLGTDKGVYSALTENGKIQLTGGYEQKMGIEPAEVLAVYVNRHNQLYISYPDKIVQTDDIHQNTSHIKIVQRDMVSGHIECIIDDKSGNTWMGNNIGIMTTNNKTKTSYTYMFPERFYQVCQLNDGQLLWYNSTGLMHFDPRELKRQHQSETLYISDIDINYNKVEIGEVINGQTILKKPVYKLNELTLNHNNNSIVFYLTNLSYNQIPNKIEYRLLPDNEEWTSDYKTQIEFSNLKPGNYTMEVRLVPIFDKEMPITRLDIHVKRHWASTPWAILSYCIILFCFVAMGRFYLRVKSSRRRFYRKKEELIKSTLSEEIKARKDNEVMQKLRNQARYGLVQNLRSPLSLIIAPLKEVISDTSAPTHHASDLKLAYRNAIGMQDVCDLLLHLHEQENEELQLKVSHYSITKIADNVIASLHELLNVTPIQLAYERSNMDLEIWIDRRKLDFVLRNILSNAFRHISYAGNVQFTTSIESIEGREYALFQIKDDGKDMIGKSATFLLSKEEGGNDLTKQLHPELGILLMKEYVTAHQGDIRIEQDVETGTTVSVYIPLGKEHLDNHPAVVWVEPETDEGVHVPSISDSMILQPKDISAGSNTKNKYKLLVIDDHKDIRLYLKMLFNSSYNVIMAENGEEGVKIAQREMPDLIISDIMMPVMDGFECCRILKEDLKTSHIPIVFLTALVGEENMVKAIELGANDYILKPFHPEILRSKVKRLIQNRVNLKQSYMKLMMTPTVNEVPKEEEKEDPFIRQIFDIVEKNLQNPDFNVKKLAEMVNMSQPTLYRRVKMLTNYTIIEVIRGVRMKRSAELLRTRKYSIQEVSEMVGYNDAPTFRKHFVDFYGTTPSNFANQEEANRKK